MDDMMETVSVGFLGFSNAGKTTLLTSLIGEPYAQCGTGQDRKTSARFRFKFCINSPSFDEVKNIISETNKISDTNKKSNINKKTNKCLLDCNLLVPKGDFSEGIYEKVNLELIDAPGIDRVKVDSSDKDLNFEYFESTARESDIVVLMVDVNTFHEKNKTNAENKKFITGKLVEFGSKVIVVLNKCDNIIYKSPMAKKYNTDGDDEELEKIKMAEKYFTEELGKNMIYFLPLSAKQIYYSSIYFNKNKSKQLEEKIKSFESKVCQMEHIDDASQITKENIDHYAMYFGSCAIKELLKDIIKEHMPEFILNKIKNFWYCWCDCFENISNTHDIIMIYETLLEKCKFYSDQIKSDEKVNSQYIKFLGESFTVFLQIAHNNLGQLIDIYERSDDIKNFDGVIKSKLFNLVTFLESMSVKMLQNTIDTLNTICSKVCETRKYKLIAKLGSNDDIELLKYVIESKQFSEEDIKNISFKNYDISDLVSSLQKNNMIASCVVSMFFKEMTQDEQNNIIQTLYYKSQIHDDQKGYRYVSLYEILSPHCSNSSNETKRSNINRKLYIKCTNFIRQIESLSYYELDEFSAISTTTTATLNK